MGADCVFQQYPQVGVACYLPILDFFAHSCWLPRLKLACLVSLPCSISRWERGLEDIASRTDFIHRRVLFGAEELHAVRVGGGLAGFRHVAGLVGRHKYRGGGVRRDGDFEAEFAGFAPPVADDLAVERLVGTLHPGQVADDGGLDDDALEGGCGRIEPNAGWLCEPLPLHDSHIVVAPLLSM